jgi:hypothetical protein
VHGFVWMPQERKVALHVPASQRVALHALLLS